MEQGKEKSLEQILRKENIFKGKFLTINPFFALEQSKIGETRE